MTDHIRLGAAHVGTAGDDERDHRAVAAFLRRSLGVEPWALGMLASIAAEVLGARSGHLFVVDYSLRAVRELFADGSLGDAITLDGTLPGRAFATGQVIAQGEESSTVWLLLSEGSERIGLLQLIVDEAQVGDGAWLGPAAADIADVVRALVLMLVSGRRYTDALLRARRLRPLAEAAESQWDLLPPLAYSGTEVAISGSLEPSYSIGGDSFDYAVNPGHLELAIVDAVGHGPGAVLMASAAINTLRNARREARTLEQAYRQTDRQIADQFGHSFYVTGQLASLEFATGTLTWVNAGHVLPLLVRNGSFVGELECRASMPMGLGGPVVEVAVEPLQPGDRVLFHTDGVTESRSPDGTQFGVDRLGDFLVRSVLDRVSPAETVRRLSSGVIAHVGAGLRDDATMLLVEYLHDHSPLS